jgi:hypothetical protein
VPTMIERDDHIPPLDELLDELQVARGIAAEAASASRSAQDASESPAPGGSHQAARAASTSSHPPGARPA